ncbi:hypothetical protein [Streptomyces sp. KL116D]|uniref:hypothetical protein n=1 Tax=Streptomyces sp. KL116D TaxID=3045152 RepID=UPI003557B2C5
MPDTLPMELASLCEPTSIAMQAVNRSRPQAGEHALVLGCGPIGLLATLYLTSLGVHVVAADTVPERVAFARRFGAADTSPRRPGTGVSRRPGSHAARPEHRRLRSGDRRRGDRPTQLARQRDPPPSPPPDASSPSAFPTGR